MTELDQKILELKRRGRSLRQIGEALGISHVAVHKRLKGIKASGRVVAPGQIGVLPEQTGGSDSMSPCSRSRESRDYKGSQGIGNQVVTKGILSPTSGDSVTPRTTPVKGPTQVQKEGVSMGSPGVNDLAGAIKDFLESIGIQVYPLQVAPECYQAELNGQIVRFYVQRKKIDGPNDPQDG